MTPWRDTASIEGQNDLDGLLNVALPFATQMLEQHGEFFPYAVVLEQSGGARMLGGDPGKGAHPASADILMLLVEGLRQQRDSLRSVALVCDVRRAESDAVRVELEHREGTAIAVFLPYHRKRLRRELVFGDLAAGPSSRKVWEL
jgi:hypothetical protein